MNEWINFIQIEFHDACDPARKALIECTKLIAAQYRKILTDLENPSYHPTQKQNAVDIISLIHQLYHSEYRDVLQQIVNSRCQVTKPLFASIMQYLKSIRYKKLNQIQKKLSAISDVLSLEYEDDERKYMEQTLKTKQDILRKQLIEETERVKKLNESKPLLNQTLLNDELNAIKQHKKYKKMRDRGYLLTDNEIYSLIFYCNFDVYCYEMRKSHRLQANTCQWKSLFRYVCSAVNKMHLAFYKNKRQKRNLTLFHGSTVSYLNKKEQKRLELNTVTSFTKDWSVALNFAGKLKNDPQDKQGLILVLENVEKHLQSGRLRGADTSWISKFGAENEYLILPTTFCNFQVMADTESRWPINRDDHILYQTEEYESKKEPEKIWHHQFLVECVVYIVMFAIITKCNDKNPPWYLGSICYGLKIVALVTVFIYLFWKSIGYTSSLIVFSSKETIKSMGYQKYSTIFMKSIGIIMCLTAIWSMLIFYDYMAYSAEIELQCTGLVLWNIISVCCVFVQICRFASYVVGRKVYKILFNMPFH